MKTVFTLLLLIVVSLNVLAQNQNSVASKNNLGNSITPIEQQALSIEKLYPNPVKDVLTLEIQANRSGGAVISLYNILGTEVKKWDSYSVNSGSQKIKIDLSFLKSGVYILKITSSNQVCSQVLKKN